LEFESLVPNVDVEDNNKKPFLDAMHWAISNENNKNIAITGPYGAGKSSLIDTFIKKEEIEDKTVKISIATFNKDTFQDTDNKNKFEPSAEFRNWLIKEERYTFLLELYNEKDIIKAYQKEQNISMILYWYINAKKLKREEIYELLSKLVPPFNEIKIGNGNNKKFEYNEQTKKLMEYLKKNDITTKVDCIEGTGIYVNNKYKRK